jgi:hypothetical protein
MTQRAAVALAMIEQNVQRIVERFNLSGPQGIEASIEDEINDTIRLLLDIRPEAISIDRDGG